MRKMNFHSGHLLLTLMLLTTLSLFFNTETARAQNAFIGAEIRPRFEIQNGYRFPPDTITTPQVLVSQRTRLNAGFTSERFNAYISIQDARIWGDEVLATDVPSFGMHEAWGQYNFNKKIGLKVGRQEIMYDNKRMITDGQWIQQGRAYDAATLKMNLGSGWKLDLVGSYNQQVNNYFGTYYNLNNPKTVDIIWLNKSKVDSNYKYSATAMIMGDGYQTPDTTGVFMRYTYGINTSFDHYQWGVNFEVYGQSGKTRTINQSGNIVPDSFQTVKAFMFSINPWIQVTKNFRAGIGLDYLSGSDALRDSSEQGTTNMFNFQYGAAHRFYGKMDIFFNLPQGTRNAGLVDAYLNARYSYKKWELNAEFHRFALENQVEDVENSTPQEPVALDKLLGYELDLIVTRDLSKEVSLNTGMGFLFPTRSLEFVKTSSFSQLGSPTVTGYWFYVMLTFKPTFFFKG